VANLVSNHKGTSILVNSNGSDDNGIDDILVDMLNKVPSENEMEQQGPDQPNCCIPTVDDIEKIASFPHRLLQAHSSFVEPRIATQGITLRQFEVLNAALLLGKPSQRDLTDYTGIDRSTLSDIINRLTSNGLTQKDPSHALPHRGGPPVMLVRRFPRSGVHAATSAQ
jgi:hypothetical protein